jgi:hypothetical protein
MNGDGKPHRVMEIIIESALLYSISALAFIPMVSPAVENKDTFLQYGSIFFDHMAVSRISFLLTTRNGHNHRQNFAPALIMLRVALGRARPDSEWSEKASNLQFGSSPAHRPNGMSHGATGTIGNMSRGDTGGEQGYEGDLEAGSGLSDSQERLEEKEKGIISV